ncbi:MAG: 50S ribosomal protein L25 [Acidobacteriota bacterium]
MKELLVQVHSREERGKNASRRLRRQGMIPAIIYGGSLEPRAVAVDPRKLLQILRSDSGVNTIFQLNLQGTDRRRHVMIKDYQVDPAAGRLMHADLMRIQMDEVIEVNVPVHLEGEAHGVKVEGGILDHVNREVRISCLPGDIPEHVAIDVGPLKIGDALRVSDLPRSDRYTVLSDPDLALVVIAPPTKEEEAGPPAEEVTEAPAEPEVVKRGKVAAEGEEGAEEGEAKKRDRE